MFLGTVKPFKKQTEKIKPIFLFIYIYKVQQKYTHNWFGFKSSNLFCNYAN